MTELKPGLALIIGTLVLVYTVSCKALNIIKFDSFLQPTITKDNDLIVRSDYQEVTLTHSFTPLNLTLKECLFNTK